MKPEVLRPVRLNRSLFRSLLTLFSLLWLGFSVPVQGAESETARAGEAALVQNSGDAAGTVGHGAATTEVLAQGPATDPSIAAIHSPPSDAPRTIGNASIRRPDPPAGFNRHDMSWIHFAYPPEARQRIQRLIEVADATRLDLSNRLGTSVLNEVHVRIARTPGEMTTLAPKNAPYPKYASGVAYPDLGLVLITLDPLRANERHDIVETFKHELAHVALHDAAKGHDVPRWFNEGFAVYVSGEGSVPRLQTLWTATLSGSIIPFDRLERSFPDDAMMASIAYAQAADLVRYLVRTQEKYRFDGLVERLARGMTFDQALLAAYGIDRMTLENEWREDIARRYTFWPVLTGSTVLWIGIVGLFFWAYHRRKERSRKTLERWRREEAAEDALLAARAAARTEQRVHIVVSTPSSPMMPTPRPTMGSESDVPKVEHDGTMHTLH